MLKHIFAGLTLIGCALATPTTASADAEPYLGDVVLTVYNFCPRDYAPASGQMLAINSNQALFSLIGTTYGGDGRTSFALPNLNGRAPIGVGNAPGQPSTYSLGQQAGFETTTVTLNQLPAHNHNVQASADIGNSGSFNNAHLAQFPNFDAYVANGTATGGNFKDSVTPTGGQQPMDNLQPYLAMQWCIALQGIYPSRD